MTKHPDEIMAAGIIAAARADGIADGDTAAWAGEPGMTAYRERAAEIQRIGRVVRGLEPGRTDLERAAAGEEMTPPPCADHQVNELGCQVCSAQRRAFYAALGQPETVVASTSNKSSDATGSVVVTVLERVWTALRTEHPELPEVVIVTGSAYVGPPRWGHHRPAGWIDRTGAEEEATTLRLGEMFVAGESLAKGARFTLETMLHEAAHVLAKARGISDTSRQGRWHNAKFKALAEELGMVYSGTQADKKLGYSEVGMTEATAIRYESLMNDLDRAIRLVIDVPAFLRGEEGGAAGDRAPAKPTAESKPRFLKLVCSCEEPRTIRVSVSSGADGIRCRECDEDFELSE